MLNGVWALSFLLLGTGWAVPQELASSYLLGPGDRIQVQVFGEPDLTMEIRISGTGAIVYPLLGEIRVQGMTASALQRLITQQLRGPYLVDPLVTVTILEYRPIYMTGQVTKPGGYPFTPGLTVRKAISLAGGFAERANRDRITVVREEDEKKEQHRPIGLDDRVLPGDIITVERSFF
jgi:polysaccharide export outer membrane protein